MAKNYVDMKRHCFNLKNCIFNADRSASLVNPADNQELYSVQKLFSA